MESTSRSHNSESSMETDGTTSIRVSLEMAGSTTITWVTVLEHDGVLQSVTIASEPGHCYIMERIKNHKQYCGGGFDCARKPDGPRTWCEICKNMNIRISEARAAVARCSICHEEWRAGDDVRRTACGHEFHPTCVETWLIKDKQGSCPNCRFQLIPGGE
ncbi:hypothetical protein MKW92_041618 [Papaver armeniacum]|nr:hypothetical protein MKW92_041618 [Papaver armeniacum]